MYICTNTRKINKNKSNRTIVNVYQCDIVVFSSNFSMRFFCSCYLFDVLGIWAKMVRLPITSVDLLVGCVLAHTRWFDIWTASVCANCVSYIWVYIIYTFCVYNRLFAIALRIHDTQRALFVWKNALSVNALNDSYSLQTSSKGQ